MRKMKKYMKEKGKNMKLKIIAIAAILASLLIPFPRVQATFDWTGTPINSGYAVTTDWHGKEVPLGEEVTAWAGTTDSSIVEVKFRWMKPDGTDWWEYGTYEGSQEWPVGSGQIVYEWASSVTPTDSTDLGDWGVQAVFYDATGEGGHGEGPIPEQPLKVAIRARSFFSVPEVSFGTIAILIAMFGALSIFAIKKKRTTLIKTSP